MAMESQGLSFTDHMEPQAGIHKRKRGSTAKERISKMPPCGAGKRSSIYRGVTRHRWTGRYEAHLWDKSTWNQTQNKKGKQVYLGAYDEEEAAARAYDLAALKYWGPGTLINFPVSDYARDIDEMQNVTREEYLASLRRKSSGFSRGLSKYKGVARHHQNGRWEARIGRVFGSKYLYLGAQEEAAAAYDMAAIEYRGVNTVTNFDLSRYIRWLRPLPQASNPAGENTQHNTTSSPNTVADAEDQPRHSQHQHRISQPLWPAQCTEPYQLPSLGLSSSHRKKSTPSALGLLLQSSMFQQMLEKSAARQKLQKESEATSNFAETENGDADFDHGYFIGCNPLSGDTNYKECYKDLKGHPACFQVEAPKLGSFEKEEEEEAQEKKTVRPKDEGGLCLWSSDFSAISN